MNINEIIIDSPYTDRGCYNCWYKMLIPTQKCLMCEIHNVPTDMWNWCEGWESEERHCIRIKTGY